MLKVTIEYDYPIDSKYVLQYLADQDISIVKIKHRVPFNKAIILVDNDRWVKIFNELNNITTHGIISLKVKKYRPTKNNDSLTTYELLKLAFEKNKNDIISDFFNDIYCTAWNDGARSISEGKEFPIYTIDNFDEFLKSNPIESGYFTEKDLKRLRK